ncbi:hypothetical protein B0H15DRAFT_832747 [Mycena belliarum]|uniref:Uncharacterized protein n=1 Tax=Mycena belliarum TaxID=1033014 RepID=A0AAD6XSU2_9AGAR|nr:hypothetical protein B0H15DRAFT_832747 [Mycena belliae]
MAGPFLASSSSTIFLVFTLLTSLSHALSIPRELRDQANTTQSNSPSIVRGIHDLAAQQKPGTGNVCKAAVSHISDFEVLDLRLKKNQVCGPESPYYQYKEGASDITLGKVNFKPGQKAPFQDPPDTKCG